MKGSCVTTRAERRLLESARQMLGGNLFEFLLFSCLGEPRDRRRLLLDAHVRGARRRTPAYRLEMVGAGDEALPGWRDPLVLAAILHLLVTGKAGRDEISFADGELPASLGWDDTEEARREVAAAVGQYCSTSYRMVSRERRGHEGGMMRRSQVRQLIPEYETSAERTGEEPGVVRKTTTVRFHPGFLAGVSGAEKHFLEVDFERLLLEQATPAELRQT